MRRGAGREREGPRPILFSRGLVEPYHIQETVRFDSNLRIQWSITLIATISSSLFAEILLVDKEQFVRAHQRCTKGQIYKIGYTVLAY